MDDQGKRVLRSFPNHPGESWNRFEGRDRRQIYNVAESIEKQIVIKIFLAHQVVITPQTQEHMIDVCILKVCDDLIAKSPEYPMRAFTQEYLQLIPSIADSLYELGYDRRGNNWDHTRLWNRMQQPWTITELLRGHERRAQRAREKLDALDVREYRRISNLPVSGYYLAAVDTPGALAGEGMIADNCAADYINKPMSRIYAVRREWNDEALSVKERARFLHGLCIFTDKNGRQSRKTAGLASVLRATAQINGEILTFPDSIRAAKKFTLAKIETLLTTVEALLEHGEVLPLDVDMPVASLEVQRKGDSVYTLMQALGPRNAPILPGNEHHQVVAFGLAALKRRFRDEEQSQLGMGVAGIFPADGSTSRAETFITETGVVHERDIISHLRQNADAEVLVGSFGVRPGVAIDDLRFLQARGVLLNLEHATAAQKSALKVR